MNEPRGMLYQGDRWVLHLAVLLVALCSLLWPSGTHAQAARSPLSPESLRAFQGKDVYEYAVALIDSLVWAKSGLSRVNKSDAANIEGAVQFLTGMKLGITDYQQAAARVKPFETSANEIVATSAQTAHSGYLGIIDAHRQIIAEVVRLGRGPRDPGVLVDRLSDINVLSDTAWKSLLWATAALTHALVAIPEDKTQKLSRLTITTSQREDLIRSLEKSFASSVAEGFKAGQMSIDAVPAALYQFLRDRGWKTSDER